MAAVNNPLVPVGKTLSFEQAMTVSAHWLEAWHTGTLGIATLIEQLGPLLASRNGCRGFFVVALTGDSPLMDQLPEAVVTCLCAAGTDVVDLTVRNLAMGTAMLLEHQRRGNGDLAKGSLQVQRRCQALLQQLDPVAVHQQLRQLLMATEGEGPDAAFLDRWGYDEQQRQAIAAAVQDAAGERGRRRMSE